MGNQIASMGNQIAPMGNRIASMGNRRIAFFCDIMLRQWVIGELLSFAL